MANLIKKITAQLIENRGTNKSFPCKTYATDAACDVATAHMAGQVREHFSPADARDCDYLVIYIEAWGRWVGAINMSEVLARPTAIGGYLGIAASQGFYCF